MFRTIWSLQCLWQPLPTLYQYLYYSLWIRFLESPMWETALSQISTWNFECLPLWLSNRGLHYKSLFIFFPGSILISMAHLLWSAVTVFSRMITYVFRVSFKPAHGDLDDTTSILKLCLVAQSCLTLCDPMGCSLPAHLQARILEWVAMPSSRGSSQPRDWTQVSSTAGEFFTIWARSS